MKEKILIIEDDKDLQLSLRTFFIDNNFVVDQAFRGAEAFRKIETSFPDLVILDLGLPDIDGEAICQQLKKDYPQMPIIILTAKNTPRDAVRSLGLGADDFVPKPFDLNELLARVNVRLNKHQTSNLLKIADLEINLKTYKVSRKGKIINLTPTEFKLLEYLVVNKDQVLSRDMILTHVWSFDSEVETRVVDVYVGYLRKKIDRWCKIKLIHNIRGFGYSVKEPPGNL